MNNNIITIFIMCNLYEIVLLFYSVSTDIQSLRDFAPPSTSSSMGSRGKLKYLLLIIYNINRMSEYIRDTEDSPHYSINEVIKPVIRQFEYRGYYFLLPIYNQVGPLQL